MIDTGAEPNLIKARNVYPDAQILREDKLHIVGVIDSFVELLGSVQVSLKGHSLRMDIVPDNFPISQKGILGTDFLKDSAPTFIRYNVQGFVKWHGIIIPYTRQDAVLIPARTAKVFYIKITAAEAHILKLYILGTLTKELLPPKSNWKSWIKSLLGIQKIPLLATKTSKCS